MAPTRVDSICAVGGLVHDVQVLPVAAGRHGLELLVLYQLKESRQPRNHLLNEKEGTRIRRNRGRRGLSSLPAKRHVCFDCALSLVEIDACVEHVEADGVELVATGSGQAVAGYVARFC